MPRPDLVPRDRQPLVTVGLPAYNGARYLREAVEDFLGQTFRDFELILSDNASTDETEGIGRELAARDRRVRYVRNPTNLGALPNANRTLELARGRYFALAAHDDRHTPDFLERLVGALEADPAAVLAYGRCVVVDEDGAPFRYDPARAGWVSPRCTFFPGDRDLEQTLPADPVARFAAVLASTSVNAPIHGLFRTAALRRTGGHVLHGSDRLIVAHAALLGRFAFVDAPLFRFRIHPGSTVHLDHAERVAREAPGADPGCVGTRTFLNYARAVWRSDLGPAGRLRAWAATAGYATARFRRNVLRPGKDNYLPWMRRPALQTAA